jgi:hypothetical protein
MSAEILARWAADAFGRYDKSTVDKILVAVGAAPGDYVTPRPGATGAVMLVPRPVGVVLTRITAADPALTVRRAAFSALATRNALLVVPPDARDVDARKVTINTTGILAATALAAGAPDGVLQVWTGPGEPHVDLVLDPPVGGVIPVLIDETADPRAAAAHLTACSTVDIAAIVTRAAAGNLHECLSRADTRPLVTTVPDATRGIDAARTVLRIHGGDRAAIFSRDPARILAYAAALPVRQVVVNGAELADPWNERLVNWVRIDGISPASLAGLTPGREPPGPIPPYPHPSNRLGAGDGGA